nr:MAG TPA: hypothetical protein [Caudoviricetes sp.]
MTLYNSNIEKYQRQRHLKKVSHFYLRRFIYE